MNLWKPPEKSVAVFAIDTLADGLGFDETTQQRREFYARFKIPFKEYGFARVRLTDPRWPALLDAIDESTSKGQLSLRGRGACWIEEPPPSLTDPGTWFRLGPGPGDFKSPARTPASQHYAWKDGQYFMSERFLEAVRSAGLTGLDWMPYEKTNPSDPMRWYQVFATHPLGRGLDHPLVDSAKEDRAQAKYHPIVGRRRGEPVAWFERNLRDDVTIDDPLIPRLYEMGRRNIFRVEGPKRFVREHLPPTDFAYESWSWKPDGEPGPKGREVRNICCNARARKALIDAGVMKSSRMGELATVPAADARAVILDLAISEAPPLPQYTPEEAAKERARRAALILQATSEAPPPFRTVDEAFAVLNRRLGDGSATWEPAQSRPEFAAINAAMLFKKTPLAWQRVAALLPSVVPQSDDDEEPAEGETRFEFEMVEPEWNDWLDSEPGSDPSETPSKHDLVIGRTPYGDWYAIRRNDPQLPADARVVHWDHETCTIADEWPNVAAFAAHIIEACDRESR